MAMRVVIGAALAAMVCVRAGAGVYGTSVESYAPGTGVNPAYTDSSAALGEPTRFTGVGIYPGVVTPFNPAYLTSEVVQVGRGGQLTVKFDHAVTDDPANLFGVDLLIFGNSFYSDPSYPLGIASALFAGGGRVEVSADGVDWRLVTGVAADGAFPTLGYSDLTDPYALSAGNVPSDFTRPVDPAFDAIGKNFAQIVAGYAGSGGGTGIDLASVGLTSAWYVRVSTDANSPTIPSIDGFADVAPAPGAVGMLGVAVVMVGRGRRRGAGR